VTRFRSWLQPAALLDLFVIGNLAFLAVDIFVAHSINRFAHPAEWIPFVFSIAAPLLLLVAAALRGHARPSVSSVSGRERSARRLGLLIGWLSVAVGVAGMVLHLESQFFVQRTLESLVYTAPFSAPLAYAGLGLLLILDRMISDDDPAWSRWVLILAAGGFFGNFVLSLADHAQNGFFHPEEWLSVGASAFAFSFTLLSARNNPPRPLLHATTFVILVQSFIGLMGFALHVRGNLQRAGDVVSSFLYGAPVFAPLLFIDIALLAMLGLYPRLASAREKAIRGEV
jgi:hypothetical protein